MIDTEKRFHIIDTSGDYCKLNEKNSLVITRDIAEATLFTFREANDRIGNIRLAS